LNEYTLCLHNTIAHDDANKGYRVQSLAFKNQFLIFKLLSQSKADIKVYSTRNKIR